jgi:hypothetical protein
MVEEGTKVPPRQNGKLFRLVNLKSFVYFLDLVVARSRIDLQTRGFSIFKKSSLFIENLPEIGFPLNFRRISNDEFICVYRKFRSPHFKVFGKSKSRLD